MHPLRCERISLVKIPDIPESLPISFRNPPSGDGHDMDHNRLKEWWSELVNEAKYGSKDNEDDDLAALVMEDGRTGYVKMDVGPYHIIAKIEWDDEEKALTTTGEFWKAVCPALLLRALADGSIKSDQVQVIEIDKKKVPTPNHYSFSVN